MRKALYIFTAMVIIVMTPAIALAQSNEAPSCFAQVAGSDIGVLTTTTVAGEQGPADETVTVINSVSLDAVAGGRVILTDVVEYQNNCIHDIEVALTADSVRGDWNAVSAQIWLSNTDTPAVTHPAVDAGDDWNDTYITVAAGTEAGFITGQAGSVIIPAGSHVQSAFVIDAGAGYDASATIRWTADARPVN